MKKVRFFTGCLATCIIIYLIIITIICGYYGLSGLDGIVLMSIFAHFTPLPYLIYILGGVGFLLIPSQEFPAVKRQLWKWVMLAAIVCIGVVALSEIAHIFGMIDTEFKINWR